MRNEIRVNDIVVAFSVEKKKPVLCRVNSIDKDGFGLEIADSSNAYESTRQTFFCEPSLIYLILGDDPPCYGSAFKVPIRPFYKKQEVKGWGDIIWLYPRHDDVAESAETVLTWLVKELKHDKLAPFAYETHMVERDPGLLLRGEYHYRSKKPNDIIVYMTDKISPLTKHIATHEYAHGLWARVMSLEMQARWIESYHNSVTVTSIGGNIVGSVLADFRELSGPNAIKTLVKDYRDQGLEQHLDIASKLLKDIHAHQRLTRRDLDILLAAGRRIEKYIPSEREFGKLGRGKAATQVTDYANKAAVEFWCESLASYYTGAALDDDTADDVAATLMSLRASR